MDWLDQKILRLLKKDSKLSNKEIGKKIHLTGQAVGQRIIRLKELGIIKNYTINLNYNEKQFIRIFMNNNQFSTLEKAVNAFEEVDEFYKVSGQACYLVVAHFDSRGLSEFIEKVSKWARYSVETVIGDRKA